MRIGIDARMMGREQATGIGNYLYQLISRFVALDAKNEYIIFVKPENKDLIHNLPKNFKVIVTNIHWYSWQEQLLLPFLIKKEKIDLMHFPNYNVPLLYFGKFIVTIHDLIPLAYPGHKTNSKLKRWLQKLVISAAINKSARIIAVSSYTKSKITEEFGINSNKITTTYLGVEKSFEIDQESAKIKATLARFQITKPYIFYVGVQRNHKNILGLIRAFEILKNEHDFQLVIGGAKNKNFPEMDEVISNLPEVVRNDILRTGFLSNDDLGIIHQMALVYVVPSFEEGFGLNALDAMSLNVPVVSSKTSCMPEIYGDAAHYFDPHDPADMAKRITEVATNDQLRTTLISRGQVRVKFFDWDTTAKETLSIYADPCQRPKEKPLNEKQK